jgi:hypothetical protein
VIDVRVSSLLFVLISYSFLFKGRRLDFKIIFQTSFSSFNVPEVYALSFFGEAVEQGWILKCLGHAVFRALETD